MTHAADGDGESQCKLRPLASPAGARGRSPLLTVQRRRSPSGLLSPPRRSSPILCVCARLSTPAHSSFYKGQPSSVHRGRTLRGGRAPSAAVRGEGGQQPSPPATAEKAQEGHRGPGFLGAPSKTQPFSWEAGIGAGQTWAECHPHGWAATEVLLRSAILCLP